ncbi:MAG TPA: hypothetical protein VMF32_21395 [Xanthobacteraceae bacterium]|nr:hypothetical protein [Xanthobacteraceae bacterium]
MTKPSLDRLVLLVCLGAGILLAAYLSPFSSPKDSAAHLTAAINYHNRAAAIANKAGDMGSIGTIPESDWQAIVSYDRKASNEAQQADIADMNRHYAGFGDHFRDEFIEGLKLILNNSDGISKAPAFLRGQILVDWACPGFVDG